MGIGSLHCNHFPNFSLFEKFHSKMLGEKVPRQMYYPPECMEIIILLQKFSKSLFLLKTLSSVLRLHKLLKLFPENASLLSLFVFVLFGLLFEL